MEENFTAEQDNKDFSMEDDGERLWNKNFKEIKKLNRCSGNLRGKREFNGHHWRWYASKRRGCTHTAPYSYPRIHTHVQACTSCICMRRTPQDIGLDAVWLADHATRDDDASASLLMCAIQWRNSAICSFFNFFKPNLRNVAWRVAYIIHVTQIRCILKEIFKENYKSLVSVICHSLKSVCILITQIRPFVKAICLCTADNEQIMTSDWLMSCIFIYTTRFIIVITKDSIGKILIVRNYARA